MNTIVLSSFQRASIQFEKQAAAESQRLSDLNITGEIDPNASGNNVAFKSRADLISKTSSDLSYEITKADKSLSTLEASLNAIDHMRIMVEQMKDLEKAAKEETNTAITTSYLHQIDELKEQIVSLGETASYQGVNLLSDWGSETTQIGNTQLSTTAFNLDDIINGLAYRGGNVLGIENGDFDTSAYPELMAAYGPDSVNNVYKDFTGNLPDGTMMNGATIAQIGPGGSYGIDLKNPATTRAAGSHVVLPSLDMPESFSIGLWANANEPEEWSKMFKFGLDSDFKILTSRIGMTDNINLRYDFDVGGTITARTIKSTGDEFKTNEWAYWTFTIENLGDGTTNLHIHKNNDPTPVVTGNMPFSSNARTIAESYIGAGFSGEDTFNGDIADLVIFDRALSGTEIQAWYDNIATTGLEKSFFTMSSEKIETALDRMEAHFVTQQVNIQAIQDQLIFKQDIMADNVTNLLATDSEEIATQLNISQLRQTLAVTSLSITSQAQSNILNLFG